MKFGENSPQQDPLGKMADKRAEEYFKKERAEKLARIEEALGELRTKLGLKPRETLRDFLNLSPSQSFTNKDPSTPLSPETASAIDDLFDQVYRIYQEGADWNDAFEKR
jgi:hypothetical protein